MRKHRELRDLHRRRAEPPGSMRLPTNGAIGFTLAALHAGEAAAVKSPAASPAGTNAVSGVTWRMRVRS